jgi:hypothetical protein
MYHKYHQAQKRERIRRALSKHMVGDYGYSLFNHNKMAIYQIKRITHKASLHVKLVHVTDAPDGLVNPLMNHKKVPLWPAEEFTIRLQLRGYFIGKQKLHLVSNRNLYLWISYLMQNPLADSRHLIKLISYRFHDMICKPLSCFAFEPHEHASLVQKVKENV